MNPRLQGVYAALLTPWDGQGNVDYAAHDRILGFLLERGVDGVVIGGGTAEYPHLELADRAELIERTARGLHGRAKMLASIGSSSIHSTLKLGECAVAARFAWKCRASPGWKEVFPSLQTSVWFGRSLPMPSKRS